MAPPHMWAEARSSLHEALWRNEIDEELATGALKNLHQAKIRMSSPSNLGIRAWQVAERYGWAKTYDAEYVALAEMSGCRLVTQDGRLRRRTQDLGFVVSLGEF